MGVTLLEILKYGYIVNADFMVYWAMKKGRAYQTLPFQKIS